MQKLVQLENIKNTTFVNLHKYPIEHLRDIRNNITEIAKNCLSRNEHRHRI